MAYVYISPFGFCPTTPGKITYRGFCKSEPSQEDENAIARVETFDHYDEGIDWLRGLNKVPKHLQLPLLIYLKDNITSPWSNAKICFRTHYSDTSVFWNNLEFKPVVGIDAALFDTFTEKGDALMSYEDSVEVLNKFILDHKTLRNSPELRKTATNPTDVIGYLSDKVVQRDLSWYTLSGRLISGIEIIYRDGVNDKNKCIVVDLINDILLNKTFKEFYDVDMSNPTKLLELYNSVKSAPGAFKCISDDLGMDHILMRYNANTEELLVYFTKYAIEQLNEAVLKKAVEALAGLAAEYNWLDTWGNLKLIDHKSKLSITVKEEKYAQATMDKVGNTTFAEIGYKEAEYVRQLVLSVKGNMIHQLFSHIVLTDE